MDFTIFYPISITSRKDIRKAARCELAGSPEMEMRVVDQAPPSKLLRLGHCTDNG